MTGGVGVVQKCPNWGDVISEQPLIGKSPKFWNIQELFGIFWNFLETFGVIPTNRNHYQNALKRLSKIALKPKKTSYTLKKSANECNLTE